MSPTSPHRGSRSFDRITTCQAFLRSVLSNSSSGWVSSRAERYSGGGWAQLEGRRARFYRRNIIRGWVAFTECRFFNASIVRVLSRSSVCWDLSRKRPSRRPQRCRPWQACARFLALLQLSNCGAVRRTSRARDEQSTRDSSWLGNPAVSNLGSFQRVVLWSVWLTNLTLRRISRIFIQRVPNFCISFLNFSNSMTVHFVEEITNFELSRTTMLSLSIKTHVNLP